jgi:hypothetical protein
VSKVPPQWALAIVHDRFAQRLAAASTFSLTDAVKENQLSFRTLLLDHFVGPAEKRASAPAASAIPDHLNESGSNSSSRIAAQCPRRRWPGPRHSRCCVICVTALARH